MGDSVLLHDICEGFCHFATQTDGLIASLLPVIITFALTGIGTKIKAVSRRCNTRRYFESMHMAEIPWSIKSNHFCEDVSFTVWLVSEIVQAAYRVPSPLGVPSQELSHLCGSNVLSFARTSFGFISFAMLHPIIVLQSHGRQRLARRWSWVRSMVGKVWLTQRHDFEVYRVTQTFPTMGFFHHVACIYPVLRKNSWGSAR